MTRISILPTLNLRLVMVLAAVLGSAFTAFPQFHIDKGETNEIWAKYCSACHGKNLEGGLAPSLLDEEWKHGTTDEDLFRNISEGIPETTMIPWKTVLSEDQIRAMVVYLRERIRVTDRKALAERRRPKDGIFTSDLHNFRME